MAKSIVIVLLALPALAAIAQPAPVPTPPMQDPVTCENVGIALAVPKGFQPKPVTKLYDVFYASVDEAGRPVLAVTLAAYPIHQKTSAEEYAEGKMADVARDANIRNLKTARKESLKVAGVDGARRFISYTLRGADVVAAQVYFIRDIADSPYRICFLLTVVTTADRKAALLPTLDAVTASVSFSPVKEPQVPAEPQLAEQSLRDERLGFEVRTPKGWFVDRSGGGAETGQVNYPQGGIPLPSVTIAAAEVPAGASNQAASTKNLTYLKSGAVQNQRDTRTVSDAAATLGGLPAWQFVLQIMEKPNPIPSLGGKKADDMVIVHRTAVVAQPGGKTVAYTVTITAKAGEQAAAAKLMDVLAASFRIVGPQTQPAQPAKPAKPAAETKPAP
jgi:hypothetical protein